MFVICVFVECPVYMHFADTQSRRWSNDTYYCFESTMVVEIFNAKVAYSVKQLTETEMSSMVYPFCGGNIPVYN